MQIAFLGLGIMGSRMAANLLKAGHPLTVWNRSAEKAEALRPLGAQAAASPAEAVRGADVVFTMLSTPAAVEAVALGEGGFLPAMQSGALWVDCSTVDPDFSRRMAAEAAGRGLRFMDAPVAGSKAPAEAGSCAFWLAGRRRTWSRFARCWRRWARTSSTQGRRAWAPRSSWSTT